MDVFVEWLFSMYKTIFYSFFRKFQQKWFVNRDLFVLGETEMLKMFRNCQLTSYWAYSIVAEFLMSGVVTSSVTEIWDSLIHVQKDKYPRHQITEFCHEFQPWVEPT